MPHPRAASRDRLGQRDWDAVGKPGCDALQGGEAGCVAPTALVIILVAFPALVPADLRRIRSGEGARNGAEGTSAAEAARFICRDLSRGLKPALPRINAGLPRRN